MGGKRRAHLTTLLCVVSLILLPVCSASTLSIPTESTAMNADAAAIPVTIHNVTGGVSGLYFKLFYDPSVLEAHVITKSDLNFTTYSNVNAVHGIISYAVINYPDPVYSNEITTAYIQFKQIGGQSRKTTLGLQVISVLNETYLPIYPTVQNGTLLFLLNGDINNDGRVNFNDAMYLYRHVRTPNTLPIEYPEVADVDGNNVINQRDVTFLIYHLFGVKGYEVLK